MVKAVSRVFLVAILQTAVVVVGDHGSDFLNGEQVCEGKGYNSTECLDRSWCCDWDNGQCWSRIGRDYCEKKNSSDNFETCYAYLNDDDVIWDAVDPLPRDCGNVPKALLGSVPREYFSDSCCSSVAAALSRHYHSQSYYYSSARFDTSFFGFTVGGICGVMTEMMNMMICAPDQATYIERNVNNTGKDVFNVCLTSCKRYYDACDPKNFVVSAEEFCYSQWDTDFLPGRQLYLNVVNDTNDETAICKSVLAPSDELVKYYDNYYNDKDEKYPSACSDEEDELMAIILGLAFLAVLGLCVAFFIYRCCCMKKDNAIPSDSYNPDNPDMDTVSPFAAPTAAAVVVKPPPQPTTTVPAEPANPPMVFATAPTPSAAPVAPTPSAPVEPEEEKEPELSFVQKLDLRELDDRKRWGTISEEEYQQQRRKIIYG